MNYLSIDYGEKHLGLAISQGNFASGLVTIGIKEIIRLAKICQDNAIDKIIIGMPEGKLKLTVKKFGADLNKLTGVKVEFYDETLSSFNAQANLRLTQFSRKNRQNKEHESAAIEILERSLESVK